MDEILNFADEKEMGDNQNQGEKDELYEQALDIIRSEGKASTSFSSWTGTNYRLPIPPLQPLRRELEGVQQCYARHSSAQALKLRLQMPHLLCEFSKIGLGAAVGAAIR